jgi:hypothetical protein
MQLNEETCPISEAVLGQLYRASPEGRDDLIEAVSPSLRATLAIYCGRRGHLAAIGLALASKCDKDDLIDAGGSFGGMLFEQARTKQDNHRSPKITLAHGAFMKVVAQDLI